MDTHTLLKTVHFDHPEAVPVVFHINSACWDNYDRDSLGKLVETHPTLFPQGIPDFVEKGEAVPYPDWCRADKKVDRSVGMRMGDPYQWIRRNSGGTSHQGFVPTAIV